MTAQLTIKAALLAALVCALTLTLAACEKPDASDVTSPSAKALLGTTTGNVAFAPPEAPPEPVASPEGWDLRLENVRYEELENGQESLQVVTQIQSQAGPGMEVWLLERGGSAVYRWSGGSAREYDGVVCFQLRLEDDAGAAMPLDPAADYDVVLAFRDPGTGEVLEAKMIEVAGRTPGLDGALPGPQSEVGRDLLGCPRSVI